MSLKIWFDDSIYLLFSFSFLMVYFTSIILHNIYYMTKYNKYIHIYFPSVFFIYLIYILINYWMWKRIQIWSFLMCSCGLATLMYHKIEISLSISTSILYSMLNRYDNFNNNVILLVYIYVQLIDQLQVLQILDPDKM